MGTKLRTAEGKVGNWIGFEGETEEGGNKDLGGSSDQIFRLVKKRARKVKGGGGQFGIFLYYCYYFRRRYT